MANLVTDSATILVIAGGDGSRRVIEAVAPRRSAGFDYDHDNDNDSVRRGRIALTLSPVMRYHLHR